MGAFDDALDEDQAVPPVGTDPATSPAYGLSADPAQLDRLHQTVTNAPGTPAARASRVLNLQLKTGLPAELIDRNLEDVEKQTAAADFDPVKFRQSSPLLASWLEQHPLHGAAAQDDLVPLTSTERALQIVKHSARVSTAALYQHGDIGAWSGMELVGDLLTKVNPGSPIGYWLREQGQTLNRQAEHRAVGIRGPEAQDPGMLERNVYGAAESIGQSLPTLASSVLLGGGPAVERLSLGMMGAQTGLPAYSEARAAGKGVAESLAFGGAQGAVEAWTEALPLHTLLGDLHAKAGLLKTVVHQMLPEVAGEEIATALQDLDEWATLHPDRPFGDYIKERPQAFVDTALATILATGAQTGALHGLARVAGGLTTGPTLEHLGDQVKHTGLATAAPGAYEDFIRHATTDAGDEVHAPIESWDTYWQEKGIDPGARAAELTGDPQAYPRAVAEGRDLPIPTARYLSQIAGSEHNAFFQNEVRFGIDALNTREAKAAIDALKSSPPPAAAIPEAQHAQLVERLTEGGQFSAEHAEQQARLVEALVGTLADVKGIDPSVAGQAFLDRIGIAQVETAPAAPSVAEVDEFGQPARTAESDATIARLTDTQPPQSAFQRLQRAGTFAGDRSVRGVGGLEEEGPGGLTSLISAQLFPKLGLPELRTEDTGPPQGATERRGLPVTNPPTGSIAERIAQMRAENPAIDREAAEMKARADAAKRPTAVFLGYGPDGPLYNVVGGPFDKSTKSAKGLEDLKIAIPDTPADTGARLNGAQLREIALKTRGPQAPAAIPVPGTQTLFQEGPPTERRGFVQFGPNDRINIGLLPTADLSTFLHETGHVFLKLFDETATELRALDPAGLTDRQQTLLNDHEILLRWLGVEPGGALTVAAHEKMAEGFIDYLHEGRAPTLELQGIFSTFRAWLIGVYRSLRRLQVELTPEVRGVFDRLLASEDAIAAAELARGHVQMFATAADMGVTPEEFALYTKATARDRAAARATLDAQLYAEVERERTAQWKAQRLAMQTQVRTEFEAQPVYRSLAAMQYGTQPNGDPLPGVTHDGPLRLAKDRLLMKYGEARVRELSRVRPYVYQLAEGGLDAEYVAELAGFTSGDEMLTAVVHAPKLTTAVEAETDARMLQAHGSLQLDGTIAPAAQVATANEYHDAALRQELTALRKLRQTVSPFVRLQKAISEGAASEEIDALTTEVAKLKATTRSGAVTIRAALPSADVIRELARDRIGSLPIRRIQPQTFWSTARRASQTATEKAARQDFDGAIVAKQQEILNLAMYREAQRVTEEITSRTELARRLDSPGSRRAIGLAGGSYQDQIDGILDRFEFAHVWRKALDRRASLAKWAAGLEAQGIPVDLPEGLLDEARRVNYQELSVDEFMGVTDGLQHIAHLARLKNTLLAAKDQREFTAERDQVADSIRAHNAPRPAVLEFRPGAEKWRTLGNYIASHTKISTIVQALDGHIDGGPMWTAFMQPINAAADAKEVRARQVGADYTNLVERFYPGRALWDLNELRHVPALNASISKEFAIAVAQNWGNEQGRERIQNDPVRHFDDQQIAAVLDLLDENDWNFVQAHWDYLDTFWSEIAAKQQRVTGVEPEKVEALPVSTKYGMFRGGYHPLVYDGRLSPRAQQFAAADAGKLTTAGAYIRTTTKRGHTKARQDHVGLPVRLDISVAFAHLDQVVHDLTHHETLIDVNRLLRDSKIAKAIYETQGDLAYEQLKDGLEDIARGSLQGPGRPTVMDKGATWLRQHTQLAMMAYNAWTAVQQPLGVFNGMDRVGVKWVAKGMARWLRDAASMESTTQWIASVSPMMSGRVTTATQDLHDLRGALQAPGGWFDRIVRTVSSDHLTQAALTDSFLWHISVAQRVADVPTWLGQYEKSLAAGEPEARAIALADQAVLDSQGGGQIKDLAKVQRGGPVARAFMTFASYGVTTFNAAQRNARMTDFRSPASILKLLGHLGLIYAVPSLAAMTLKHAFGRGKGDDDPLAWLKDVAGDMMSSAMSGLVYAREVAGAAQIAVGLDPGARGYSGPAALRPFQVAYDVATQIKQGEADTALWHAVNSAAGFLFAYPSAQVQKTVDGAIALYEGRTSNPAAVVFGPPPKE